MDTGIAQWAHMAVVVVAGIWYIVARYRVAKGDRWAAIVPALAGLGVLTLSDHFVRSVAASPYFDSTSSVLIGAYFLGLAVDVHVLTKERRKTA
ncbi:MAG: hypothetical protein COV99_11645 [Bacteroidetes bacterium CG12_big_fil_rev_8_21_14_0_65_60_17]|nr:MAG: hypothetical protein COV99_11645 [Bacteroidetes bacterium CG12_big_fil_rev_8_21_14_0_65_60_17]